MTPAGLSAAIKAGIIAALGPPADATKLQEFCDGLSGVDGPGAIPYIQANAVVTSAGTVTAGVGIGDPVTTTGSIT